jgi:hypothetical protein
MIDNLIFSLTINIFMLFAINHFKLHGFEIETVASIFSTLIAVIYYYKSKDKNDD